MEGMDRTLKLIGRTQRLLGLCSDEILRRLNKHDRSFLESPEKEDREKFLEAVQSLKYGSNKYDNVMCAFSFMFREHYGKNDHHPEHFGELTNHSMIGRMNLFQILEMLCTWKTECEGSDNDEGWFEVSLSSLCDRYRINEPIRSILRNTANYLTSLEKKKLQGSNEISGDTVSVLISRENLDQYLEFRDVRRKIRKELDELKGKVNELVESMCLFRLTYEFNSVISSIDSKLESLDSKLGEEDD